MLSNRPHISSWFNQDPEFRRLMARLRNARTKTVVHHETCPCCGAKLVNLYRKNTESGEWRCRLCWEEYERINSEPQPDPEPAEVDSNG